MFIFEDQMQFQISVVSKIVNIGVLYAQISFLKADFKIFSQFVALFKMVRYVFPATSEAGARCQDKNVSSREDTFLSFR
jgi:hypothetical protein